VLARALVRPELRDDRVIAAEASLQLGVLLWERVVQPGADDGDRSPAGVKGGAVSCRVDPGREP